MQIKKMNQMTLRYLKDRQRNVLAKPGIFEYIIILDNLKAKFNVPKIFRSAEAFGAKAVHLINIGPFDPSPAKGSFRKVPALFYDDFDACYQTIKTEYTFFVLEAHAKHCLTSINFPKKSAFILGNEELGISFNKEDYPEIQSIAIPQFGSVESLNVSIAASIVMYEYVKQLNNPLAI